MCENLFLSVGGRVIFFGQVPAPLAPPVDIGAEKYANDQKKYSYIYSLTIVHYAYIEV